MALNNQPFGAQDASMNSEPQTSAADQFRNYQFGNEGSASQPTDSMSVADQFRNYKFEDESGGGSGGSVLGTAWSGIKRQAQNLRAAIIADDPQASADMSNYARRKAQAASAEYQAGMSQLGSAGQFTAGLLSTAPEIAASMVNPMLGAAAWTASGAGEAAAAQQEAGSDYDVNSAIGAGLGSAVLQEATGGLAGKVGTSLAGRVASPLMQAAAREGAEAVGTGAATAGQQVMTNLAAGKDWNEGVPEAAGMGMLTHGVVKSSMAGINKALGIKTNRGGEQSIKDEQDITDESGLEPNNAYSNQVHEFNNFSTAMSDDIANTPAADDISQKVDAFVNLSMDKGSAKAFQDTAKLAQEHGMPITANFFDQNISEGYRGTGDQYNLAKHVYGLSDEDLVHAGEAVFGAKPTFFGRAEAITKGETTEALRDQLQKSYKAAQDSVLNNADSNYNTVAQMYKSAQMEGSPLTKQYQNLVADLKQYRDWMRSQAQGKSPDVDSLEALSRRVINDSHELGIYGELKGVSGDKGSFNPVTNMQSLQYLYDGAHRIDRSISEARATPTKTKFAGETASGLALDATAALATHGASLPVSLLRHGTAEVTKQMAKRKLRGAKEAGAEMLSKFAADTKPEVSETGVPATDAANAAQNLEAMGIKTEVPEDQKIQVVPEQPTEAQQVMQQADEAQAQQAAEIAPATVGVGANERSMTNEELAKMAQGRHVTQAAEDYAAGKNPWEMTTEEIRQDRAARQAQAQEAAQMARRPTQEEAAPVAEEPAPEAPVAPEEAPAATPEEAQAIPEAEQGAPLSQEDLEATRKRIAQMAKRRAPAEEAPAEPVPEATKPEPISPSELADIRERVSKMAKKPHEEVVPTEETPTAEPEKPVIDFRHEPLSDDAVKGMTEKEIHDHMTAIDKDIQEKGRTQFATENFSKLSEALADRQAQARAEKAAKTSEAARKPKPKAEAEKAEEPVQEAPKSEADELTAVEEPKQVEKPKTDFSTLVRKPLNDKISRFETLKKKEITGDMARGHAKDIGFLKEVDREVTNYADRQGIESNDVWEAIHTAGGMDRLKAGGNSVNQNLNLIMKHVARQRAEEAAKQVNVVTEAMDEAVARDTSKEAINKVKQDYRAKGIKDDVFEEANKLAKERLGEDATPTASQYSSIVRDVLKARAEEAKAMEKSTQTKEERKTGAAEKPKVVERTIEDSRKDLENYATMVGMEDDPDVKRLITRATRSLNKTDKALTPSKVNGLINKIHDIMEEQHEAYQAALAKPETVQPVQLAAYRRRNAELEESMQHTEKFKKELLGKMMKEVEARDKQEIKERNAQEANKKDFEDAQKALQAAEEVNKAHVEEGDKNLRQAVESLKEDGRKMSPAQAETTARAMANKVPTDLTDINDPEFKKFEAQMEIAEHVLAGHGKQAQAQAVNSMLKIVKKGLERKAEFPDSPDLWVAKDDIHTINQGLNPDSKTAGQNTFYGLMYEKVRLALFGDTQATKNVRFADKLIERKLRDLRNAGKVSEGGLGAAGIKE